MTIQIAVFRIGDQVSLTFTTVLDELMRGPVDEDEDVQQPATRADWDSRGGKEMVAIADRLVEFVKEFDPRLELNYRNSYIGLARNGVADNFVLFRPRRTFFGFEPFLKPSPEVEAMLETAGLPYERGRRRYRIRLTPNDIKTQPTVIRDVLKRAYESNL